MVQSLNSWVQGFGSGFNLGFGLRTSSLGCRQAFDQGLGFRRRVLYTCYELKLVAGAGAGAVARDVYSYGWQQGG